MGVRAGKYLSHVSRISIPASLFQLAAIIRRARMSSSKDMRALVFHNEGHASVKSIPLPELRSTYLLIKVDSVALNPTDFKHITYGRNSAPFSIVGCDYAGTVL